MITKRESGKSDEEIARETEHEIRERFCNAVSEAGQNSVVYPTFEEIQFLILSALREARQQESRSFKEYNTDAK